RAHDLAPEHGRTEQDEADLDIKLRSRRDGEPPWDSDSVAEQETEAERPDHVLEAVLMERGVAGEDERGDSDDVKDGKTEQRALDALSKRPQPHNRNRIEHEPDLQHPAQVRS